MKTFTIFAGVIAIAIFAQLIHKTNTNELSTQISCSLSPKALQQRNGLLKELFSQCKKIEELKDGYSFEFSRTEKTATELLQFVFFEQKCCSFFTFELAFPASNSEAISLRLRGGDEVKEFVKQWLQSNR